MTRKLEIFCFKVIGEFGMILGDQNLDHFRVRSNSFWSLSMDKKEEKLCDCRKAFFDNHNDHQYLDVITTLNNFDSFANFSKTFFTILCNKLVRQPRSTTGRLHSWVPKLSVMIWFHISLCRRNTVSTP